MRFHRNEVMNFNIVSMGEEFGPRNILSLKSMVKSTIGLERGGQMSLCLITENNHTSLYIIHDNFYD